MAVFRRVRNGKESATFYCKFTVDGRQVLRNTGCRTARAAERWKRQYVEQLRSQANADAVVEKIRQIKSGGRQIATADAARLYLDKPLARPPGKQRRGQIVNEWARFADFAAARGEAHLAAVTPATAQAYARQLQQSGKAVKTVNEYAAICRQIFAALATDAGLGQNPFNAVPKLRGAGRRRHAFSRDELRRVVAACDDELRPLAILAACTGMRLVDCVRLSWPEVDLAGGWIVRRQSKTGAVVRCPILPRLRQTLADMPDAGGLVFPGLAAVHRRRPSTLSDRFAAAIRTADATGRDDQIRDFHSIRHAFVWMAAECGIPLSVVQAMAGHLTPAMTRLYADHATAEAMTAAAARIGDPLGAPGDDGNPLAVFTTAQLRAELARRQAADATNEPNAPN